MPATYSVAPAPYSERGLVEMDGIGRRLFPGHEPPRAVFDTIAFLCQIAHASVVEGGDAESTHEDGPGYVPRRQSDLRTKVGALVACASFSNQRVLAFAMVTRAVSSCVV